MGSKRYFWLVVDAAAALTDQVLDMLMLYEYADNEDWDFFGVGIGTIVLPSLVFGIFGIIYGSSFACHEQFIQCINFFPGINIFFNAARLMRAFLGEQFEGRGEDWVDRWFQKYEEEYVFARLLEAMLEAGPQTVLQAFVALRRPEGINPSVLYASMGFSILSVSKTLVTTIVLGKQSSSLHHTERVRMFLLSTSYELCEVVSRVFSVATFGYVCGGYFIAAVLAGEYVLLLFVLIVGSGGIDSAWVLLYPLLLQFTSLACSKEFTFRKLLLLRIFVLAAYGAVSVELGNGDTELAGNAKIFFWIAVVANVLWALLMPAFCNSCCNLNISLEYSSFEPKSFTNHCRYPLEVHMDVVGHDEGFCCGCVYNKKTGEVIDKATDVADNLAGVG